MNYLINFKETEFCVWILWHLSWHFNENKSVSNDETKFIIYSADATNIVLQQCDN